MKFVQTLATSVALVSGLAIGGCTGSQADTAEETATLPRAEPVRLAFPKTVKPGAAVTFTHADKLIVPVGTNGSVDIAITEPYPDGEMTLTATGSDGLSVFGAQREMIVDLADGNAHEWRVAFEGANDGVAYINLMASVTLSTGQILNRVHAIRVEVGDLAKAAPKKNANIQVSQDGEAVIVMNAQEVIEN